LAKALGGKKISTVQGLYRNDIKAVDAILVSYGHGDHIGLVEHVHPEIPIYIGEKALRIYNVPAQFTERNVISNPGPILRVERKCKSGNWLWLDLFFLERVQENT